MTPTLALLWCATCRVLMLSSDYWMQTSHCSGKRPRGQHKGCHPLTQQLNFNLSNLSIIKVRLDNLLLYACVRMFMCMCVLWEYKCVCLCEHICGYMCTHMHCVHMYASVCKCPCVCKQDCVSMCMNCMCMHVSLRVSMHIWVEVLVCTDTYMWACLCAYSVADDLCGVVIFCWGALLWPLKMLHQEIALGRGLLFSVKYLDSQCRNNNCYTAT